MLKRSIKRFVKRFVRNNFGLEVTRKGSAWSLIEIEQLERFLKEFQVDCVFDVGANEGQYAEHVFDTGFSGTVVSFEPNPSAVTILRRKAAGNPRWRIVPTAADEVVRDLEFNIMAGSQFSSLHLPDHTQTDVFSYKNKVIDRITITTTTIDKVFQYLSNKISLSRPFLKMDTQGHDLSVVKGAKLSIGNFVGLQSELAFTRLYDGAPSYEEALDMYRGLGFKLTAFIPNNAGHFPDLNEVDCLMYNTAFTPPR